VRLKAACAMAAALLAVSCGADRAERPDAAGDAGLRSGDASHADRPAQIDRGYAAFGHGGRAFVAPARERRALEHLRAEHDAPAEKRLQPNGGRLVRRRLGQLEERLLREVLGVGVVAREPPREVEHEALRLRDERLERQRVALARPPPPEGLLGSGHGRYLHGRYEM